MTDALQSTSVGANQPSDFVLAVVKSLCYEPGEVSIDAGTGNDHGMLEVTLSDGDLERLTGKGNRVERSLRTLISAFGAKSGTRYSLSLRSHQ